MRPLGKKEKKRAINPAYSAAQDHAAFISVLNSNAGRGRRSAGRRRGNPQKAEDEVTFISK